jgi:hypothetical protein
MFSEIAQRHFFSHLLSYLKICSKNIINIWLRMVHMLIDLPGHVVGGGPIFGQR